MLQKSKILTGFFVAAMILFSFTTSLSAATNYQYDDLHRLVQVTKDDGTTVTYTYDAAGNRETMNIIDCGSGLDGDLNNDNKVDIFDLVIVAGSFGLSTGDAGFNPVADTNSDGTVDIFDLVYVGTNFGNSCP